MQDYIKKKVKYEKLMKEYQKKIKKYEKEIRQSWEPGLSQYKVMRKKYLLYP